MDLKGNSMPFYFPWHWGGMIEGLKIFNASFLNQRERERGERERKRGERET
jgi:hypothetical protein